MIKRPLNARFADAVLEGIKTTTIRDKAWPIGKPIMLYSWSGAAYRSKQVDVAAVVVEETTRIRIGREKDMMMYHMGNGIHLGRLLWMSEGFLSSREMDEWFRDLVKPGQWIEKSLMRFRLANATADLPAVCGKLRPLVGCHHSMREPRIVCPAGVMQMQVMECVACGDQVPGVHHLQAPDCSAFVGKTVEDEEMGRGLIIDETPSCVGVLYRRERKVMRVHYIPKRDLRPNNTLQGSPEAQRKEIP